MWKLLAGFVAFAALALFVLMKSGGDVDLSGEKHEVAPPAAEQPPAAATPAVPAASATAASAPTK